MSLLRLPETLILQPFALARAVTAEERRDAQRPDPYYYGWAYGEICAYAAVALVPSLLAPLTLPAGALYFALRMCVDKYNRTCTGRCCMRACNPVTDPGLTLPLLLLFVPAGS